MNPDDTFTFDELRIVLVKFSSDRDPLHHHADYHAAIVDRWLKNV